MGTDKEGNLVTGFLQAEPIRIIPNRRCYLGVAVNEKILDIILKYMTRNHISAYDEEKGKGLVRHVLIRSGFTSGEFMVCLVINGTKIYPTVNNWWRTYENSRNDQHIH